MRLCLLFLLSTATENPAPEANLWRRQPQRQQFDLLLQGRLVLPEFRQMPPFCMQGTFKAGYLLTQLLNRNRHQNTHSKNAGVGYERQVGLNVVYG